MCSLFFVLPCTALCAIPRRVLLLGGNGMMGSATSQLLLAQGHHVTVANRLRWDWDTAHTIAPFVRQLYCDRHHMEDSCTRLRVSGNYDAVVDFSTYRSA